MSTDKKYFYQRLKIHGWEEDEEITLSTRLILEAADTLGIQWKVFPGTKIIELHYGKDARYFRYQISDKTSDVGFYGCLDKSVTKSLLSAHNIQVPKGFHITQKDPESYWHEVYQALKHPLVVKPTYGMQGQCVSMGVTDEEIYITAIHNAFGYLNDKDAGVIVEETFSGKEYRVLATREKVIGVINRLPANVVGDGVHTLEDLINEKNSDPRRSDNPLDSLVKIKIDDHVRTHLQDQHLELDFIPAKEQRVFLRNNSNISTGGDSIDMTDVIHPSVAEISVRAVNAIPGLDFVGVDFMTEDITKPQTDSSYCIIEINSSPGFSIHEFPYIGTPRKAQYEFLYIMFPELKDVR